MGITGTYIRPSENIVDLINNKIDTAYYILDDILFNNIIEKNVEHTKVSQEITEVKLVVNIYNNYNDRVNRINKLEQVILVENVLKNTNFGNLWEIYYVKSKILLKKYLEDILIITLQNENIIINIDDELPDEYKNVVILTDA